MADKNNLIIKGNTKRRSAAGRLYCYITNEEFALKHIEALQMIAGALNWSERTEEKVLQFAARINMEVENDR